MTPLETDDLNHLLLNCRLRGDLSAGLRYAYGRLDTIDRKSSELFRSFTFITGSLVALCSLMSRSALHARLMTWLPETDDPKGVSYAAAAFVVTMALTLVFALAMLLINVEISRLRYYRIGEARLAYADAVAAMKEPMIGLGSDARTDAAVTDYLRSISAVTVRRESQLRWSSRCYYAGLANAFVCLLSILWISSV